MQYYLDTNIIIYAIKGSYPNLMEHFKNVPKESIVIPEIVFAEIEYGARKSGNYEKTIEKYNKFTIILMSLILIIRQRSHME